MKVIKYIFLMLFIPLTFAVAQEEWEEETDTISTNADLLIDSLTGFLPDAFDINTQNLLENWHVKHFTKPEDFCLDEDENPYCSDSVYKERLARLPFVVPVTYNSSVRNCIDRYAVKLRKKVRFIMGMADYYFPMIEEKLDANDLPLELKYLAVVESALDPIAQSRVGAAGLWQFMLSTGKIYGLEINSLIDERFDPEKATDAACRYFREMYDLYGDWLLVIAAYNCGPGNVNKAIRRSGGSTDFWRLFQYLPRETRSYVPLYIAMAYIMTYHCDHNLCPVRADFSVATDTLIVSRNLHFDQIADILQIDKEAVRFYNPQYKREIIPGGVTPSVLRLPLDKTFSFMDNEDSVYTHRYDELLALCPPVDISHPESRMQKITHTSKAGETVYTIANLYGVKASDLRRWNGLSGRRVPIGRKLKVYVDNGGIAFAEAPVTTSKAATTATATSNNATKKTQETQKTTTAAVLSAGGSGTYIVKSGDSLYLIAKRYPGISAKQIQEANGLTTTKLQIGQVLIIPT
ncbi:MAG: transglycosylase SLT domain-containing protein, partial [Tannerella sp.]|nr:transglycosylase SLT domain-containing protein [Tannerella sp.]